MTQNSSFDPVSLEIMWSRLINISEECWLTIRRTAFSLIIGESLDFGCELLDAQGNSLAHAPRSMPVFNLALPRAARALLAAFPAETLQDGDILITNDPWLGAGHLFDIALITPVFRHGRMVGAVASMAHCSDIGGTRDSLAVREVYEEGLQIPPMKFYRAGQPNHDLMAIIRQNVRKPEMVMGDLHAQVSANAVGVSRLLNFMDEYALEDLTDLASIIQQRAERAMRNAIAALPDGTYSHTLQFDSAGNPLEFTAQIRVEGEELYIDWQAPPQLARGGINSTLTYTMSHTAYVLKCILTPEIPSNAGCYLPFHTTAPAGSVLNCDYPAGVNSRTSTGWFIAPTVFAALAPILPHRTQAFTGLPISVGAYGQFAGETFNDFLFQGGGQGGSVHSDGKNGLLYPTSASNTSVEMFESRTPMLVLEKTYLPDSGGAGTQRGGLGQRIRMRKRVDDQKSTLITLLTTNLHHSMPGLSGGLPARLPQVKIIRNGQTLLEGSQIRGIAELCDPQDEAVIELSGGSGYGLPQARGLERVAADLEGGYITVEGLAAYGCQLDARGRVVRRIPV